MSVFDLPAKKIIKKSDILEPGDNTETALQSTCHCFVNRDSQPIR